MKNFVIVILLGLLLASCNDYLERRPLDFGDEESFYRTAEDLRYAANKFYEYLPQNDRLWGGLYSADIVSDNQMGVGAQPLFYQGDKLSDKVGGKCEWNFEHLRGINFFINKIKTRLANGELSGNQLLIDHYLGEGYFFRAYDYFRLLRNYGDVPIITQLLPDNLSLLISKSRRSPRNEVARFVIANLDSAIVLLQTEAPEAGRICRDAAYILKARVALYEASWERYHAETCFVPGNDKWVGATMWSGYTFPTGSAEAEVDYFLERAIEAARIPADNRPLDSDYSAMFNRYESAFDKGGEVILARYYAEGILSHSCSAYLSTGGGCNATRALVNSFLMTNGLPIYAEGSGYGGDANGYDEMLNRDCRLVQSVRFPGFAINGTDTLYFHRPQILNVGNEKATTGYEIEKWVAHDLSQSTQYLCTTAVPLFRSAECRLIYMEAYYMRYGMLDSNADRYWRELRRRAGVDEDYTKTIAATDLTKENDLAVWSKGQYVDATLYNIRRERRCEFIAEGMRLDDLKRWRALDMMVDYHPEGINLWGGDMTAMWDETLVESNAISHDDVSNYLRPLQISSTSKVYNGYNFPKSHYLEPIPLSEILLSDGVIYQNPGWSDSAEGPANYNYDCD